MTTDIETRKKKLSKKAFKGEVHTRECYDECLSLGVQGKASLIIVDDKSRKNAKHDLRLQDARELLVSVLFDRPVPKQFQIKNKPFIQSVHVINIANCEDILPILGDLEINRSYTVSVSREQNASISLPSKLLSLSEDEANFVDPDIHMPDFEHYILSDNIMRLWKYPLPILSTDLPVSSAISGDLTLNPEPSPKKPRLASDLSITNPPIIGVKAGQSYVPSQEEADFIYNTYASDIFKTFTVNSKEDDNHVSGYVETVSSSRISLLYKDHKPSSQPVMPATTLLAIDCEMCLTSEGSELTRLTIIDQYNRILLDTFVKPSNQVCDYLTTYSGISEEVLADVNITFRQAQLAFLRIVHSNAILVGHSLDNDLRALKVLHRRCIDTAIIYPHPKGYPYRHKLKHLAQEYLNIKIQQSGESGHDSIEDARTSMMLAVLKQERGPSFGTKNVSKRRPILSSYQPKISGSFFWSSSDEEVNMMNSSVPGFPEDILSTNENINQLLDDYCVSLSKPGPSISDVATSTHVRFMYLGINLAAVDGKSSEVKDHINRIKRELLSIYGVGHSLVLITSQPSKEEYETLKRRKKACSSPQTMAVWSPALEMQMKETLAKHHTGRIYIAIV